MPDGASNIDEVIIWLEQFQRSINMTRPGRESSLGKDIAMTIIRGPDSGAQGGIIGRISEGVGPDGSPWKPLSPRYAEDKLRKYGWDEIARRTGQAMSAVSLYGRTTIEPEQVTLIYGTGSTPDHSVAPTGYISEADKKITDSEKGAFLTEQGRPFYGIGEGDPENVTAVAQENANELIIQVNQSRGA